MRFFIQLRCMKAFLPSPPNQAVERSLRFSGIKSPGSFIIPGRGTDGAGEVPD